MKKIKYIISSLMALSMVLLSSCKDDKEDLGTPRLFQPLSSSLSVTDSLETKSFVIVNFNAFGTTKNTSGYVIRISPNADFSGAVETKEIILSNSNVKTISYKITKGMLIDSTALYDFYISVKATSSLGSDYDSKYCTAVSFSPYRENIFKVRKLQNLYNSPAKTDTLGRECLLHNQVTFYWGTTLNATRIRITDQAGNPINGTHGQDLTTSDANAQMLTVTGLSAETNYVAYIYEGTTSRGRVKFKTTSASESIISGGGDLQAIIDAASDGAVLRLQSGTAYTAAGVTINKNITIESFQDSVKSVITGKGFILDGSLSNVAFKSLSITGAGSSDPFINGAATLTGISNLTIDGCVIKTFKNLINYGSAPAATPFNSVVINNSIISDMLGSAHFIDLRNDILYKLYITNSTLYNFNRGIVRAGSDLASPIITNQDMLISNNTIYKCNEGTSSHFIYTGKPANPHTGTYVISNNILAVTNLTSGGMYFCGTTSLTYNNFYNFIVRNASPNIDLAPFLSWSSSSTRNWGVNANNNGYDDGTSGYNPNFVSDPTAIPNFTPGNKALNTMSSGNPVGAPYWVKK